MTLHHDRVTFDIAAACYRSGVSRWMNALTSLRAVAGAHCEHESQI